MPLIGRILQLAEDSLIETKLIKVEQGPAKTKGLIDPIIKKASYPDKTELCRMSNYDVFLAFVNLLNDTLFTFEETLGYCKEVQKQVNSWTFEKDGNRLMEMYNNTNNDGSLTNLKYTGTMTDLGLTPIFISYKMQIVYLSMYHFLKLKQDILTPSTISGKLPLVDKINYSKTINSRSLFSDIVTMAEEFIQQETEKYKLRQEVSAKRLKVTKQVIKSIEKERLGEMEEIPEQWHIYLDPTILELIYEIIQSNLVSKKVRLDKEEQEKLAIINKSPLTTYLFSNNLNPYSLPEEQILALESIPSLINKIEFFKALGIPVNNILTKYYDYLSSITEEQLAKLNFLIDSNVLSRATLKDHLSIIGKDYQRIIDNYEILKDKIDFNNRFYKDSILLKDIREIKRSISVLKEYNLSLNNSIFLLCNYEYLYLYDLMLEKEIPTELFISICKTENPLNTLKRILIYISIGEPYVTINNFLKKDVTSEAKFVCDDDSLDQYLPNVVETNGLNLVSGTSITQVTNNELVKRLDKEYRVDNIYMIGGTIISRPKFLRNFESVQENPNYLIISLISGSILNEKEYYDLTNELKQTKLKK